MNFDPIPMVIGYSMAVAGPIALCSLIVIVRAWTRRRPNGWQSFSLLLVFSFLGISVMLPSTNSTSGANQDFRTAFAWGLWSGPVLGLLILISGFRAYRARAEARGFEVLRR